MTQEVIDLRVKKIFFYAGRRHHIGNFPGRRRISKVERLSLYSSHGALLRADAIAFTI